MFTEPLPASPAPDPTPPPSTIAAASQGIFKTATPHVELLAPGIELVVWPGAEIGWEEFVATVPPYSIALDGVVRGAPRFDLTGTRANFNHHQDVDRLATRSTAAQVLMALRQGLLETFQEKGAPQVRIYVNDPDQDSSLAVWLLANHGRCSGTRSEPLINRLVGAEDVIDTTAGAYPYAPQSSIMQELAWIFEPYVDARMAGRIRQMDGSEMANVITSVGSRISRYAMGQGGRAILDTRFEELGGGDGWSLIREQGFYARTGLFAQGIKAFVSFLGEDGGRFHYSIGKMSAFVPFPIKDLYLALNEAEGLDSASGVCWNGGDTIGGSPRRVGSSLPPARVVEIINSFLKRSAAGLVQ